MPIQEVSAEQLAELLHHYQQILATDFGETHEAPAEEWQQVSRQEKKRLIAAARLALTELAAKAKEDHSRYYAKPGEAEWGC